MPISSELPGWQYSVCRHTSAPGGGHVPRMMKEALHLELSQASPYVSLLLAGLYPCATVKSFCASFELITEPKVVWDPPNV